MITDTALDQLLRAIQQLLGKQPRPRARRIVATLLRAIADWQERIAEAQEANERRPPQIRLATQTRHPKAGPGAKPGTTITIERSERTSATIGLTLFLGRKLVYDLQKHHSEPIRRLDVQRIDDRLCLVVVKGDLGWALQVRPGLQPRMHCSGARDRIWEGDGTYQASVERGMIILGSSAAPASSDNTQPR